MYKVYHITWATHNSRVSERMIEFEAVIKQSRIDKGMQPFIEPILLNDQDGIEITNYITSIAREEKLRIIAYNICQDHIHLLLVCKEAERDLIVQKLKSISSRKYNISHGCTQVIKRQGVMTPCPKQPKKGIEQNHLWAQKYGWTEICVDKQLSNTLQYIQYNREKHGLPVNEELQLQISKMLMPLDCAFDPVFQDKGS